MSTARYRNVTRNVVLAERATRATSAWARAKGLLGRAGLEAGEGLEIAPCAAIHTWFMRFAIDVLFLAPDGRVVRAISDMRPWRMTRFYTAAASVLELPAGTLSQSGTREGDIVSREELSSR